MWIARRRHVTLPVARVTTGLGRSVEAVLLALAAVVVSLRHVQSVLWVFSRRRWRAYVKCVPRVNINRRQAVPAVQTVRSGIVHRVVNRNAQPVQKVPFNPWRANPIVTRVRQVRRLQERATLFAV